MRLLNGLSTAVYVKMSVFSCVVLEPIGSSAVSLSVIELNEQSLLVSVTIYSTQIHSCEKSIQKREDYTIHTLTRKCVLDKIEQSEHLNPWHTHIHTQSFRENTNSSINCWLAQTMVSHRALSSCCKHRGRRQVDGHVVTCEQQGCDWDYRCHKLCHEH